ncbi:MAG: NAD(P)/FAD-dependent oxidoreductase, partial [Hyphomicrobiales bacterium]
MEFDTIVIGGGLVGAAVAYGLARQGYPTPMLDESDIAFRASVGNFGLIWVQGKGDGMPEYASWTKVSADLWPEFAARLAEQTSIDVNLRQPGGLRICLDEAELAERASLIERMRDRNGADCHHTGVLDRAQTKSLVPSIGPRVVGATFGPRDGHANPLLLLRALHRAGRLNGLQYLPGAAVVTIEPNDDFYRIRRADGSTVSGRRIVLAAGLGNAELVEKLGRRFPVRPQRGQILVTGRTPRFLDYPTQLLRQTGDGTVMIGDSKEDAGFDTGTTAPVTGAMAARAVATFPHLADVPVVRTWGALRVMSPDGCPIYQTWSD